MTVTWGCARPNHELLRPDGTTTGIISPDAPVAFTSTRLVSPLHTCSLRFCPAFAGWAFFTGILFRSFVFFHLLGLDGILQYIRCALDIHQYPSEPDIHTPCLVEDSAPLISYSPLGAWTDSPNASQVCCYRLVSMPCP